MQVVIQEEVEPKYRGENGQRPACPDNADGDLTVYQPFEPDRMDRLPATIMIPPERLVVLAET